MKVSLDCSKHKSPDQNQDRDNFFCAGGSSNINSPVDMENSLAHSSTTLNPSSWIHIPTRCINAFRRIIVAILSMILTFIAASKDFLKRKYRLTDSPHDPRRSRLVGFMYKNDGQYVFTPLDETEHDDLNFNSHRSFRDTHVHVTDPLPHYNSITDEVDEELSLFQRILLEEHDEECSSEESFDDEPRHVYADLVRTPHVCHEAFRVNSTFPEAPVEFVMNGSRSCIELPENSRTRAIAVGAHSHDTQSTAADSSTTCDSSPVRFYIGDIEQGHEIFPRPDTNVATLPSIPSTVHSSPKKGIFHRILTCLCLCGRS